MFCDGCGAAVQPGQAFCGKCGKQILGPIAVMQNRPGRVQGHLQLLGILWLAISAFNTIGGVVLYILANTLFTHLHEMGAPEAPTRFCVRCSACSESLSWLKRPAAFSRDGD